MINYLDNINDVYPLSQSAEAAAIESLNHVDKINERVVLLKRTPKDLISSLKTLGIVSFPIFFLIKIPYENLDADEFANRLAEHNIHVRPLHLKGLENKFIRFATSTVNNSEIVISTIKEILGKICI